LPPDASSDPNDAEESCIQQSPELLVARAVLRVRRTASREDSLKPLKQFAPLIPQVLRPLSEARSVCRSIGLCLMRGSSSLPFGSLLYRYKCIA
jgi:hypothetical protein